MTVILELETDTINGLICDSDGEDENSKKISRRRLLETI